MKKRIVVLPLLGLLSVLLTAGAAAGAQAGSGGTNIQTGSVGEPVTEPDTSAEQETSLLPEEKTQAQGSEEPPAPHPADGKTVLQWEGYSAELLRYKVNKFEHSDAAMYLYMRIVNHTDRKITLRLDNVTADGVSVIGAGIYETKPGTDTGAASQEYCLLVPDPDHNEEGSDAIVRAEEVKAVMIVKDSDSQEELFRQEVTIHLAGTESERTVWEHTNGQTAPASEPVEVTASPDQSAEYKVLQPWSKGEDVRKMQEKLIELGYLDDKADGSFGPNTQEAVKAFNDANGLPGGTSADAATQQLLFSGRAAEYTEPEMPLMIASTFEYEPAPDDNAFFFRIQVTNESRTRTIRGYELEVYTTDVWDKKLSGEETDIQTMTQKISPGETLLSGSFYLDAYDAVDTVWVRIDKVVFTDGEIRINTNKAFYPCELASRISQ